MTDNIVGRIDPNIPQFWVHCEAWSDWPERVLISNSLRGETVGEVWYIPERTCRIVTAWKDSDFVDDVNYRCSECSGFIPVYERNPDDYFKIISAANYCPSCGAKVVEE